LVDVDAFISDKLFGVCNDLLIVIDEWRVPAPPVMPQFINLPCEDLYFVERLSQLVRFRTTLRTDHAKRVSTRSNKRHCIAWCAFPPRSAGLAIAAAGKTVPRRRLSFEAGTLLAGFVDLGWTVTIFLEMCPEEVEAALEGGLHLSDSCVDSIVNGLEELSNLVDAE
jgi:hypothetical protein